MPSSPFRTFLSSFPLTLQKQPNLCNLKNSSIVIFQEPLTLMVETEGHFAFLPTSPMGGAFTEVTTGLQTAQFSGDCSVLTALSLCGAFCHPEMFSLWLLTLYSPTTDSPPPCWPFLSSSSISLVNVQMPQCSVLSPPFKLIEVSLCDCSHFYTVKYKFLPVSDLCVQPVPRDPTPHSAVLPVLSRQREVPPPTESPNWNPNCLLSFTCQSVTKTVCQLYLPNISIAHSSSILIVLFLARVLILPRLLLQPPKQSPTSKIVPLKCILHTAIVKVKIQPPSPSGTSSKIKHSLGPH